eukprot:CAMPEP_0172440146 /NCGR_PEP_ID=MMETSP1065-20121228/888_1 /TAXON_ID=265537 /ORGANISM="Amphiprora paludosa, Strain CCMP125" /LENGTH=251 /DNA_ID=CAMNT_0013188929 /DNA_START=56 /DNA_END=811 /DNA_ORIENTATION=+
MAFQTSTRDAPRRGGLRRMFSRTSSEKGRIHESSCSQPARQTTPLSSKPQPSTNKQVKAKETHENDTINTVTREALNTIFRLPAPVRTEDPLMDDLTESSLSTVGSFNSLAEAGTRKGCLKAKTQEASLLTSTSHRRSARHSVQFTTVTIHYHNLIVGDHPQVTSGVPVALGSWQSSQQVSVTDYEQANQTRNATMSTPWSERCQISAKERQRRLLEAGVPLSCIQTKINCMKIQRHAALRSRCVSSPKLK